MLDFAGRGQQLWRRDDRETDDTFDSLKINAYIRGTCGILRGAYDWRLGSRLGGMRLELVSVAVGAGVFSGML